MFVCLCLIWEFDKLTSPITPPSLRRRTSQGRILLAVLFFECFVYLVGFKTTREMQRAHTHSQCKYSSSLCILHIQATRRDNFESFYCFFTKEETDSLQRRIYQQSSPHYGVVFLIFVVQYWADTKQEKPQCWFAISSRAAPFRWLIWGRPSVAEGCRRCRGKIMDGSGGGGSNKKVAPVRLQPRLPFCVCLKPAKLGATKTPLMTFQPAPRAARLRRH